MSAIICALLSAAGFFFSIGLGEQWWLAWLAPVPVLWLAYRGAPPWQAFLATWAAYALGSTNILKAYLGSLPPPVLALSILAPSLLFAVAVNRASWLSRRLGPMWGVFGFAVLWSALDFLSSFNSSGGAIDTPAASQVGMPLLIQSAALFGPWIVTFLLGFVSAGMAMSLATRAPLPAALAAGLLAADAVFGFVRMQAPAAETIKVALIDTDNTHGEMFEKNAALTGRTVDAYAAQVKALAGRDVKLILLPENLASIRPGWRDQIQTKIAAGLAASGATLVAGFNDGDGKVARNVSWTFQPGARTPLVYVKRQLVPGLETARFAPGSAPKATPSGIGLEICKDMDFQAMIRRDEVATHPRLLAVPAWDFGADGYAHAREAILRSVENGVPMARDARDGLLTLNDRYGRVVAMKETGGPGFTVLVGELPLAGVGGETLYDRIGDLFGWLCVAAGAGVIGWTPIRRPAS